MLSKYQHLVPRDPLKNVQFRLDVYLKALDSPVFRKGVWEMCRRDILFYINTFVWQFNPKKKTKERVGPFITWDYQEKGLVGEKGILWCYEHGKTAVVEKSRDMGASWAFLIFEDWLGIFHEYTKALNISKSSDAVDCADPDSLFWKIRFMHEHLPTWLTGPIVTSALYIGYKRTHSYATGAASTGRAGVGGRAGVIFVDEFPLIREAAEVRQRTAGTSDCRFFNGTHLGTGTEFYNLTQTPEIIKQVWHWSQHPDKKPGLYRFNHESGKVEIFDKSYPFPPDYQFIMDGTPTGGPYPGIRSPWYDQKCIDIGNPRGVAMELDINPQGSVSQVFNPIIIRQLRAESRTPVWEGELDYDKITGHPRRLVRKSGGRLKLWIPPDGYGKVPLGHYTFGVDVATGSGATPSCVCGMDADKGQKILQYADAHIEPTPFAVLVVGLSLHFCSAEGEGARLVWEVPGPGQMFGQRVLELGYGNVYYRVVEDSRKKTQADTPGWYNGTQTKMDLILKYCDALQNRLLLNPADDALEECLNFRFSPGGSGFIEHSKEAAPDNPAGARVSHGDLVIADALMWLLGKSMLGVAKEVRPEDPKVLSFAWRVARHEEQKRLQELW